jgi:hypothetical protein
LSSGSTRLSFLEALEALCERSAIEYERAGEGAEEEYGDGRVAEDEDGCAVLKAQWMACLMQLLQAGFCSPHLISQAVQRQPSILVVIQATRRQRHFTGQLTEGQKASGGQRSPHTNLAKQNSFRPWGSSILIRLAHLDFPLLALQTTISRLPMGPPSGSNRLPGARRAFHHFPGSAD